MFNFQINVTEEITHFAKTLKRDIKHFSSCQSWRTIRSDHHHN